MVKPDGFDSMSRVKSRQGLVRKVQSWDTANKATELSDYSVCTTWGVDYKHYYLIDVVRRKLNYPDLKRAVIEEAKKT